MNNTVYAMSPNTKCVCGDERQAHITKNGVLMCRRMAGEFCALRGAVVLESRQKIDRRVCVCGAIASDHNLGTLDLECPHGGGAFTLADATPRVTGPGPLVGNGNPKDFVGASKAPLSTVSRRVMHELGLAMLEGECKYWRHNYRAAPVRAMVYLDALDRHLSAWIEGQEIDPDSGLSHLVKAMACLAIVRDAQLYGSLIDDRPPAQADPNWMAELNAKAKEIVEGLAGFERGAYTEANREEWPAMNQALSRGPIRRGRPA